jgi:hypothetical protein
MERENHFESKLIVIRTDIKWGVREMRNAEVMMLKT